MNSRYAIVTGWQNRQKMSITSKVYKICIPHQQDIEYDHLWIDIPDLWIDLVHLEIHFYVAGKLNRGGVVITERGLVQMLDSNIYERHHFLTITQHVSGHYQAVRGSQ